MLDSAVEFMLEYEIHQNNDPECIKYLRKKLVTDITKLAVDNTEPPAASTRPPAKNEAADFEKIPLTNLLGQLENQIASQFVQK